MGYLILWLCSGALGLGILVAAASKRGEEVSPLWYFLAIPMGPVFLAFVVPVIFAGKRS